MIPYRPHRIAAAAVAGFAATAGLLRLPNAGAAAAPVIRRSGDVVPFPAPPPGVGVGRLHTLPAFQCRLLRDGPPGRCAPLSGDGGWNVRTRAEVKDNGASNSGDSATDGDTDVVDDDDDIGRPQDFLRQLLRELSQTSGPRPALPKRMSKRRTWAVPRSAAGGADRGVPYPAALARALTLRRNSLGGHVLLAQGDAYEILVLSHTTAGRCPGEESGGCGLPIALATLGARRNAPFAALTVTTPVAGGNNSGGTPATPATRLATWSDAPLLSVGRAVLADGRWLAASDPVAPPPATITSRLGWRPPPPLRGVISWVLGDKSEAGVAASAAWLGATAAVLCGASSTFVDDQSLCEGVPPARLRRRFRHHHHSSDLRRETGIEEEDDKDQLMAAWEVGPPPTTAAGSAPPVKPCAPHGSGNENSSSSSSQPAKASRTAAGEAAALLTELAPSGPRYRAALAGLPTYQERATGITEPSGLWPQVGLCVLPPPPTQAATSRAPASPPSSNASTTTFEAALVWSVLSQALKRSISIAHYAKYQYARPTYHVDAPSPPTSDVELILAVIVVLPEVATLALLGLASGSGRQHMEPGGGRRHRRRRDHQAYCLILCTGVVSLTGIVVLAVAESRGARWRAAAVLEEVATRATEGSGWAGVFAAHTEQLTIIAAVGYRPRLAGGLAIGLAVAYAVVAVVSAACLFDWPCIRRQKTAADPDGSDTAAAPSEWPVAEMTSEKAAEKAQ